MNETPPSNSECPPLKIAAGNPLRLFSGRCFLPVFLCQFLGAFNDNLLRSGLAVMISYAALNGAKLPIDNVKLLVTVCSALLVVPFICFSFIAGQVADKYEKAHLVTVVKLVEIFIMAGALYGFATQNILLLMALLFASGAHSTFFGPIKYSILPDLVREEELLAANGFVAGSTNIGILLGMISGGLLASFPEEITGLALVGAAAAGLLASLFIPRGRGAARALKIDWNVWRGNAEMISHARESAAVFSSVLGLSWFMLIGSVFMSQFPNFAGSVVGGDNTVYTLFLGIFSVGVAAGAVLCNKLLKGQVSARFAPVALLGVSVFTLGMLLFMPKFHGGALVNAAEFTILAANWPMLLSMLMVAVCGGVYMVPLHALLQTESAPDSRSRVIAASNLFDSLFMTLAAVAMALLFALGADIPDIFFLLAILNLGALLYARKNLAKITHHPA